MTISTTRRIHIAPLGYEIDRISQPAIKHDADEVILVVPSDDDERSDECLEQVKEDLSENEIGVTEEQCDIFDPDESIQTISAVIREHPRDDVKVNIATGTKITAISGMLACMLTSAEPYYVRAEDYGEQPVREGVEDVVGLPAYPIDPPKEHFVKVLDFLRKSAEEEKDVKIQDINAFVRENDLEPVQDINRSDDSEIYDIVGEEIIDPLKERNHVDVIPKGGSKYVVLREEGERTLEFCRYLIE